LNTRYFFTKLSKIIAIQSNKQIFKEKNKKMKEIIFKIKEKIKKNERLFQPFLQ
jgi:proteasome assembly chaperone (PAC2) family protein